MSQHIPALTGIRGVAAVWVVLFHLSQSLQGGLGFGDTAPFIQTGFLGVDLFFILSGAVMYHVHCSDFPRYSFQSHLAFLKLRFARVYPLHAFCLIAFAVAVCFLPDFAKPYRPDAFSFSNFMATLLLVNNWGILHATLWNVPAWSLSAEWLGYLAFPFITVAIGRFVPRGFELPAALALLATLVGCMLVLKAPDIGQMNKLGILRMAFEFSAGCLLYKAAGNNDGAPRKWTLVLALAITLACSYHIKYHWGALFGLGLLVLALCKKGALANLLFGNPVALWLGNISFSLYLSHWPLIQIYQWTGPRVSINKQLLAALLVVVIVLAAMLLFRFVEVPSRRYLRQKMQTGRTPDFAGAAPITGGVP